jgi:hypothetical protein
MIHPNTEVLFVSKDIGYGLFATAAIPKGTITFAQDPLDIIITSKKFLRLDQKSKDLVETYCFMDQHGDRILSWDNGKYVNHSCNPNTMSTGYGFEIALRNIQPGEEITDEYGLFNVQETIPLHCNCKNCRKHLKPTDIDQYVNIWDNQIRDALVYFTEVDQPLLKMLEPITIKNVLGYLNNNKPYVPVSVLKFNNKVNILE